FEQTQKLLPAVRLNEQYAGLALDTREELETKMARQLYTPYTSVLLWFDREITDLDHAWLLDTTIEWFFHKSRIRRSPPEKGSYVEVVVAGPRARVGGTRGGV